MQDGPKGGIPPGLIATLAARMRERPNDAAGWMLLGRGYAALGQPGQAAKALKRAVDLSTAQNNLTATLLSDYGEAALQGEGTESQDASNAFARAQALDPKDMKARYYLGLIAATHGKTQEALQLWQSLLADAPPNAPWRQNVVDQVAALNAAAVNAGAAQAPDVQAMVAGLAARLQDNPNDLPGWQRLLRAYAVLGDREKLQAALAQANAIFASNAAAKESLAVAAAGQAR